MEHIRIDRSRKPEVGRQRNRHGPSTRGDPDIRGKPTMGVGVFNFNITDLESPPPDTVILSEVEGSLTNEVAVNNMRFPIELGMTAREPGYWLQWESRVLAAKNSVGFFGNFIPNGDWFAREEVAKWVSRSPNRDYKSANRLPDGSQGIRTTRTKKVAVFSTE